MTLVCPKCAAENPDNAFFCAKCHTHIRSAFGSPESIAVKLGTTFANAPTSGFATSSTAAAIFEDERPAEHVTNVSLPGVPESETESSERPAEESQVSEKPFVEIDRTNILDKLAIVSDGEVITIQLDDQSELTARKGAERVVTLPDMFPMLRSLSGSQYLNTPQITSSSNTSGQREKSVLPSEARGFSWAGFVPGGAFGFTLGLPGLGLIGLIGLFSGRFGLFYIWPLYMLWVGVKGRELAWRNRRFESVAQYVEMTTAWDKVGKACLVIDVFIYLFVIAVATAMGS